MRRRRLSSSADDLVAFYAARLDETEVVAKAASRLGPSWYVDGESGEVAARQPEPPANRMEIVYITCDAEGLTPSVEEAEAQHIALHDPARTLRRVAAGRKLLAEYEEAARIQNGFRESGYEEGRREVLEMECRLRAYEWDDHPDFNPRWKL
jgi:hypothetical protein